MTPSIRARLARLRGDPARALAAAIAFVAVVLSIALVVSPTLADRTTYGVHDWDVETAHRYLTAISLARHHEAPLWNPYACGGFPEWGYVEGGTIVVSPWLPAFLALSMPVALRVELVGTAILGALGAWLLAGRFTRSLAGRAFVVVLWAVNGRWALQAASGHTWHFAYAWMPFALYCFERAMEPSPRLHRGWIFGLAASLAMLVYAGGIYPLPHTILALGVYATALAIRDRATRPLRIVALSGALAVGLSAPKLFPMFVTQERAPRTIDSTEVLAPRQLWQLLTDRAQTFRVGPFRSTYGWHEYGMYLSVAGVLALLLAVALVWERRATELKIVGLLFVVLGFGAFHAAAPWTLLHAHAPMFRSLHVPSRFLYPAALFLALVAAVGIGRLAERAPWLDAALAAIVLAVGVDVAAVARRPMTEALTMVAPKIEPAPELHYAEVTQHFYTRVTSAAPMYLEMLANEGVVRCYGLPPFGPVGARSRRDPRYRGEAFTVDADGRPAGEARVAEWSPNHERVALSGAKPGALLVLDVNYDEGWTSDAGPIVSWNDAVAVRLDGPRDAVTFRYAPASFRYGLFVGIASVGGCLWAWARERERRRAASAR